MQRADRKPGAFLDLAVDLGGTRVRTAVVLPGTVLEGRLEEPTAHDEGPRGVVAQIARLCRRSLSAVDRPDLSLRRLAIATPGPADARTGIVYDPPNLRGWHEVPLRAWLQDEMGVPTRLVNDANAAALAEHVAGAGRGTRNMVYLTISTGIGGGIILNGELIEGSSGTAGELGHTTLDLNGPVCNCGNVGCLEVLGSGTAIARRFAEQLKHGRTSAVCDSSSGASFTAAQIVTAAESGDALALEVFHEGARAVAAGVVSCIHSFNPDIVILGGGVTKAGALLFDPVRAYVDRHTMRVPRAAVRISAAELGDDVGLMGAAFVAVRGQETL